MSRHIVNQRWWLLTGSRYEITYISARTHDINEILTATPTFSRSSNSVELVPISGCRKSKTAAVELIMHVSQLVDMIECKF